MRLKEIEKRLAEIKGLLTADGADVDALNKEVDALIEERNRIIEQEELRKKTLASIAAGEGTVVSSVAPVAQTAQAEPEDVRSTAEFRRAWLKSIACMELSQTETRAMAVANGGIPTTTANKIIEAVSEVCPVIEDVDMYYGSGYLKIFKKTTQGSATEITAVKENAQLTSADFTLTPVELSPKRYTEYIAISGKLDDMALDDLENKIVEDIANGLAKQFEVLIIAKMNSVDKTVEGAVTMDNIIDLYGSLKAGYARRGKWYMNHKTFAAVYKTINKSKNDMYLNGKLMGSDIRETDQLDDGVIIFGDAKYICAELGKNITIERGRVLSHDQHEWLGATMFDCELAFAEAFVKLAPATE